MFRNITNLIINRQNDVYFWADWHWDALKQLETKWEKAGRNPNLLIQLDDCGMFYCVVEQLVGYYDKND